MSWSGRRDRRVGGREIENEALRNEALKHVPISVGMRSQLGRGLKAKYAIHALAMKKLAMIVGKNHMRFAKMER